jgi:sugar phosphate isomerase/epimerase
MFWPWHEPIEAIRRLKELGATCGQLGIPGDGDLSPAMAFRWRAACESEAFPIATVFAAYDGESYADLATVKKTVGFVPRETRAARLKRTCALSDFAAILDVRAIACHVGFVPESESDGDYVAVRNMVRQVCDHAAGHGQVFALETGQEPSAVLRSFIHSVARPNLRINFDPANLILYGTQDPIEALAELGPWITTVHAKDGLWPAAPGALGEEVPLGQGAVGMERFLMALDQCGFRGSLHVERELPCLDERYRDMRMGIGLLKELRRVA